MRKGFTYIEILVAVTIIGVMASLIYPEAAHFLVWMRLKTLGHHIAQTLRLARYEAIKRQRYIAVAWHDWDGDGKINYPETQKWYIIDWASNTIIQMEETDEDVEMCIKSNYTFTPSPFYDGGSNKARVFLFNPLGKLSMPRGANPNEWINYPAISFSLLQDEELGSITVKVSPFGIVEVLFEEY